MNRILHLISSPNGEKSRSWQVANKLLKRIKEKYPDLEIDTLDLFETDLPKLAANFTAMKASLFQTSDPEGEQSSIWSSVKQHIDRFLAADTYVLSVPMWNFSIPYVLKQYIDIIVQPGYLFKYTAEGPVGMLGAKKMIVVTSRGGDYSEGSPAQKMDFQEPYLKTIFGFAGLSDLTFINLQPTDSGGEERQKEAFRSAYEAVNQVQL